MPTSKDISKFNRNGTCAKCGGGYAKVIYCKGNSRSRITSCSKVADYGEHLHRVCFRCNFEWIENCLDHEGNSKKSKKGRKK